MTIHTPKTTLFCTACWFAAILAGTLHGDTITFEPPYTVGDLSASTNGGTTDAPFTAQQGWSLSHSDDTGGIIETTSSGEYVGGQAMYAPSGTTAGSRTYAGGQIGNVSATAANTITFDVNYYSNSTIMASFFGGTNPNVDLNDAGIQFGFSATEMLQIRYAGFGAQFGIGVSASSAGVANGDWLRYSITIGDEVAGNRDYSVALRNLTDGVDIDLNGAADGLLYTGSATAAQVGVAPEDARGGFLRLSGQGTAGGFVDNLTYTAASAPSPDLKITSISVSGNTATIVMTGTPGTDYYCAGSADLTGWTTEIVPTAPPGGSPFQTDANGALTFTVDTTSLGSTYFFRVQDSDPAP